eukprot:IDg9613t1
MRVFFERNARASQRVNLARETLRSAHGVVNYSDYSASDCLRESAIQRSVISFKFGIITSTYTCFANQEEGIRSIAPAAKPSTDVVTSCSTAAAVALYERCASVSSSTKVESIPIKKVKYRTSKRLLRDAQRAAASKPSKKCAVRPS